MPATCKELEKRSFKIELSIRPVSIKNKIRIHLTARVLNNGKRIRETKKERFQICRLRELQTLRPFYHMMKVIMEDIIENDELRT
ncbi:MAG: hypothetical protein LBU81_03125 [Methanosarcinales archaeon]|nr:hypothetical protein [Methanosarcinales archaeon]